jgi:hypothetical protein
MLVSAWRKDLSGPLHTTCRVTVCWSAGRADVLAISQPQSARISKTCPHIIGICCKHNKITIFSTRLLEYGPYRNSYVYHSRKLRMNQSQLAKRPLMNICTYEQGFYKRNCCRTAGMHNNIIPSCFYLQLYHNNNYQLTPMADPTSTAPELDLESSSPA